MRRRSQARRATPALPGRTAIRDAVRMRAATGPALPDQPAPEDELGYPNGGARMPGITLPLPASLAGLLAVFEPLFTAPSFRTFSGMACGFLAQTGKRTVCGMLTGAGLSRLWPHDRAHSFFSRARRNPDDLGLTTAKLVVSLLVPDGEPVVVAIDDTLFRRRGKKVWAAGWFHDGAISRRSRRRASNSRRELRHQEPVTPRQLRRWPRNLSLRAGSARSR
jgi:hypothetical protein